MRGLKDVQRRWGDDLSRTRWDEVERLLAEHYRRLGFVVDHVGTGNSRSRFDGGIDLKLHKDGRYTVVQCKHWNVKQVPHNAVHELIGVMATEGAQAAVLATSGEFTAYARESAAKVGNIELVDGATLRAWLGPVLPAATAEPVDRLGTITGAVLEAAADRWLSGSRKKSRQIEFGLAVVVVKAALTGILLLAFYLLVPKLFERTMTATLPRPQATSPAEVRDAATKAAPAAPASAVGAAVAPKLTPYQPAMSRHDRPASIAEIGAADEMMTPVELEEWKRKNEESMRVLEQRVPELQH